MRLSARNQLAGEVVEIEEGAVNGVVKIRLDGGQSVVNATITMDSIKELGLGVSKKATAVIKASDVIVGVD
ncbi:molybdenum-pterin-binding protein [Corynebacterium atypicum]|uniref:Molybdenum-pterin-binding protein n=1 Tax=Corynebacterium atypicum TaxID=191610 RepID=A0ABN4DCX9_9CORY|nr:TOBE domain-containing protein [Corynebacterium atypicum]AIG64203.1 molybdenum-pterin-binding protein [Corynebacterium atypicum]